jgi:predicted phosphoribosyltransferase
MNFLEVAMRDGEIRKSCFRDREDAGVQLAGALRHLENSRPLVLALPRGGVPVAAAIAVELGADLDLLLVRKLGVPRYPEVAMGAVSDGSHPRTVINWDIVHTAKITQSEIESAAAHEIAEIERRRRMWLDSRPPASIKGRTAIIVDDGIATGASVFVALDSVRGAGAARIVVAAPVAPPETAAALRARSDEVVILLEPEDFRAVGEYYADFHQLEDDEVRNLLAWQARFGELHPA